MSAQPEEIRRGLSAPTDEQTRTLAAWRTVALETMPYMASLLFLLRPLNAPGLGTFAVDDRMRLYVDFDAVADFDVIAGAEALLHECSHIMQGHSALPGEILGADPQRLNIAADMAINDDLVEAGCTWLAANGVTPMTMGFPDGLTPHEYYRRLEEEDELQQSMSGGDQAEESDGQDGQGQGGEGQPGSGGQSGQSGQDDSPEYGCGAGAGVPGGFELDDDDDFGGAAPPVGDYEKEAARVDTAHAARSHAKSAGSLPGGIQAFVDDVFGPPVIPWQRTISAFVSRISAFKAGQVDTTIARRNRRRHGQGIRLADGTTSRVIHPGEIAPDPTIAVIRDTSGSMGEELGPITREIEGIAAQVGIRGDQLRIYDADTQIQAERRYARRSDLAQVVGRGGTMIGSVVRTLAEPEPGERRKGTRPDLIIALTDGGTFDWPTERLRVPVIVGIVGDQSQTLIDMVPDWMHTVKIPLEA